MKRTRAALSVVAKPDEGPTEPVSFRAGGKLLAAFDKEGAKLGYKRRDRAELLRLVMRKFVGW